VLLGVVSAAVQAIAAIAITCRDGHVALRQGPACHNAAKTLSKMSPPAANAHRHVARLKNPVSRFSTPPATRRTREEYEKAKDERQFERHHGFIDVYTFPPTPAE